MVLSTRVFNLLKFVYYHQEDTCVLWPSASLPVLVFQVRMSTGRAFLKVYVRSSPASIKQKTIENICLNYLLIQRFCRCWPTRRWRHQGGWLVLLSMASVIVATVLLTHAQNDNDNKWVRLTKMMLMMMMMMMMTTTTTTSTTAVDEADK